MKLLSNQKMLMMAHIYMIGLIYYHWNNSSSDNENYLETGINNLASIVSYNQE